MYLTKEELIHLKELIRIYEESPLVQQMKNYIQHGVVSTYDHCGNVMRVSFWMNRRFHIGADEKALVIGAFLHDFYLYDWHDKDDSHKLHGYFHAEKACRNAIKHFKIDEKVQHIISCHMWPLNLTKVPLTREAVIVCLADKYCSTIETLLQRKGRTSICG